MNSNKEGSNTLLEFISVSSSSSSSNSRRWIITRHFTPSPQAPGLHGGHAINPLCTFWETSLGRGGGGGGGVFKNQINSQAVLASRQQLPQVCILLDSLVPKE